MMRPSQLHGRDRLADLLAHNAETDDMMGLRRHRFSHLEGADASPRVVSSFNLFQTPEPLAARVVALLGRTGRTLEPSAGLGRLYHAYRDVDRESEIVLVDISPDCCGELYRITAEDRNVRLIQGDFLEQSAERIGLFDCIIMNPPFKMWRDIKHIEHAKSFLASGGRIVSICANGPRQREKLMTSAITWIDLPDGSFKSEGTNVNTAIYIFDA